MVHETNWLVSREILGIRKTRYSADVSEENYIRNVLKLKSVFDENRDENVFVACKLINAR